jgi:hypothetical protein
MSAVIRARNARRQLETFEEAWQQDHAEAMQCRDFEASIELGVWVFDYLDHVYQTLREQIYRGITEGTPELTESEKTCYERWLHVADSMTDPLQQLQDTFGVVEGVAEFQKRIELARERLRDWKPAALARSTAARVWDVSEEEADQIHNLLNTPLGAPGRLTHKPKALPPGDASMLR